MAQGREKAGTQGADFTGIGASVPCLGVELEESSVQGKMESMIGDPTSEYTKSRFCKVQARNRLGGEGQHED